MKEEMVTIKACKKVGSNIFRIRATQEYCVEFNCGHYKYVITDKKGHIVKVGQSIGGSPGGKIDAKFLDSEMERFCREYEQYQKYLKKERG